MEQENDKKITDFNGAVADGNTATSGAADGKTFAEKKTEDVADKKTKEQNGAGTHQFFDDDNGETHYIYDQSDFVGIKKQRKNLRIVYFSVLGVFIAACIALLVVYLFQPYRAPSIKWIKAVAYVVSGIFVIFSFIFLGIPYKRVKNYYKFLHGVETGTNNMTVGVFDRYVEEIEIRDGIEYKAMIFLEYNTKKQDFFERKTLFDSEKKFPEFTAGENLRYYTHGNVFVAYEKI